MIQGFRLGLSDPMIADKLNLSHMQVFNFRKANGITSDEVKQNRYNTWIEMLGRGLSLESLAKQYRVKPLSIRQALWRERGYSFKDVKKKGQHGAVPTPSEKKEKGPK
ncbi:hypothetical protein DBR42_07875 [Pelomonas sp. HMWF004]|nr:hypothetical protein DBR42_07875 [Pelomonas sp. HMWF004]